MIPKHIHYIYGLKPQTKPFPYFHYVCILSALTVQKPEKCFFHYHHLPTGEYFEKIAKRMILRPLEEVPTHIFGNPLTNYAHVSDVLRLQILLREGGIYCDIDVLHLRPFDSCFMDDSEKECVMGVQKDGWHADQGLCNAVIMAAPQSRFLQQWFACYRSFRGKQYGSDNHCWDEHSVYLPYQLAQRPEHRNIITILPQQSFFFPSWDDSFETYLLLPPTDAEPYFSQSYCIHFWQSCQHDFIQKTLSSPDSLQHFPNTFLARVVHRVTATMQE